MGFSRGIDIITDELIFYWDAANKRSYPGSGTTINNLVGIENTATLVNGAAYNTDQKGHFVFDGVNDHIELGDNDIFTFGDGSDDSAFSISAWCYVEDASGYVIADKYSGAYDGEYYFYTSTDDKLYFSLYDTDVGSYGAWNWIVSNATVTSAVQGKWTNLTCTYDGRGGSSANVGLTMYINGAVVASSTATYATYTAMHNTNITLQINRYDNVYQSGKMATYQMYSKELSAAEILQNYNALKDRFI